MLDDATARILRVYLDDAGADEPTISPDTQWRIVQRYLAATVEGAGDVPRVRSIEALAAARLLVEGLQAAYDALAADCRRDDESYTDIGQALNIKRQSAQQKYKNIADAIPAGSDEQLDRYRRLLCSADDKPDE